MTALPLHRQLGQAARHRIGTDSQLPDRDREPHRGKARQQLGEDRLQFDAGERRDEAVRDGVVLSTLANAFGAVWGFRGRPGIAGASRAVYISALAALVDGWARLRGTRGP